MGHINGDEWEEDWEDETTAQAYEEEQRDLKIKADEENNPKCERCGRKVPVDIAIWFEDVPYCPECAEKANARFEIERKYHTINAEGDAERTDADAEIIDEV